MSVATVTRRILSFILIVAMGACGSGARDHLTTAAESADEIKSGVLNMSLSISGVSDDDAGVGFGLQGPFDLGGEHLEADFSYQQMAGSAEAELRFVTVGGRAFVQSEGSFFELPVGEDATSSQSPSVLQELDFESWAADPVLIDGASDEITIVSPLEEFAALRGIRRLVDDLEMAEASGLGLLDGLHADALRRSVDAGTLTVRIGKDDQLLRALTVRLRFALDPSSPLSEALKDVLGAELEFSIAIEDPNQPVRVETPADPQPISELPGSGG